jgi:hypothetical protein
LRSCVALQHGELGQLVGQLGEERRDLQRQVETLKAQLANNRRPHSEIEPDLDELLTANAKLREVSSHCISPCTNAF